MFVFFCLGEVTGGVEECTEKGWEANVIRVCYIPEESIKTLGEGRHHDHGNLGRKESTRALED